MDLSSTQTGTAKRPARYAVQITALSFFAYAICYLSKNIVGALQPQIAADATGFDYAVLGAAGTAFLLAYGAGQLVNGLIGDRISPRVMIFGGLVLSGGTLFLFPLVESGTLAVVLWGFCGLFCSMFGGPLAALIGNNIAERAARVALTLLLVATVFGSLVSYVLAVVGNALGAWRPVFFVSGAVTVGAALVWEVLYRAWEKRGIIKKHIPVKPEKKEHALGAFGVFLNLGFIGILFVVMFCSILRNALANWIPTLFVEYLDFSQENSAFISILLPLVNFVGTFASLPLLVLFRGKEKPCCGVLFLVSAVSCGGVLLTVKSVPALAVAFLFLSCFAINGVYNLVFSVYILHFKGVFGLSGVAGIIDSFAYLAAAAANVLFTSLSSSASWERMIFLCTVFSVLGIVSSVVSLLSKKDVC